MITVGEAARAIPKVELHYHLEGSLQPGTLAELSKRHGVDLGVTAVEDLYSFTDMTTFFDLFRAAQSVLKTREDWARLAHESVLDAAKANIVYREAFISPAYFLGGGQKISDIIAGLAEGLESGEKATGIRTMLIGGIDRAYGPAAALELVQELADMRRCGAAGIERVIGIGMDGIEVKSSPADFVAAFKAAGEAGFHRTSHQGAEGPPSNIAFALDVLGCERIDHGIAVLDDAQLTARARDEGIAFTVCPSSNISVARYGNLQEHPFPKMRKAGLKASLHSDDPGFTRIDLADEFKLVADAYDCSWEEMVAIALDAVAAAWLSDSDRRDLTGKIRAYTDSVVLGGSAPKAS